MSAVYSTRIRRYKLVKCVDNVAAFEEAIGEHLAAGWELHGSPGLTQYDGQCVIIQAMVYKEYGKD